MFHHRSCGTTQLVALMAAHRAAHQAGGLPGGDTAAVLRQQDITRLTEALLATPGPEPAWHPHATPRRAAARN